jgi:hypothetical protein
MSKKKGLGRDINTSLEKMDALQGALKDFAHAPIKEGLSSNRVDDDGLHKAVNKAIEDAVALSNQIKDIKGKIKGINIYKSSRFAASVVRKFLDETDGEL